jgi:hypothetical protein
MPASAARRAKRAVQNQQPNESDPVDGKQAQSASDPQMERTAERHGKQSQRGRSTQPQKTTHRLVNLKGSSNIITQLLQPIPNRKPINSAHAHLKTIPGAAAIVSTWGTEYTLAARGLSELQVKRACDKAYLETFNQMQIMPDQQYEPEFIATFKATVQLKACRIMESKRRRCARASRQPGKQ